MLNFDTFSRSAYSPYTLRAIFEKIRKKLKFEDVLVQISFIVFIIIYAYFILKISSK
jgi:hypothetical protein